VKTLRMAILAGVLLTQSGCVELLLLGMEIGTAGLLTKVAMDKHAEKQAEPEAVVADVKIPEK
jgi:hypothetical protein